MTVETRHSDEDIYRLALDTSQAPAREVLYIDDRAMFVQVAATLGICGIHHRDYSSTCDDLMALGLEGILMVNWMSIRRRSYFGLTTADHRTLNLIGIR